MSDGWKMKDGKRAYLRRLRKLSRMAKSYGAQTFAAGTPARSEGDNVIILRTNAKKGREVMGVSDKERAEGQAMWDSATSAYVSTASESALLRAADKIGKLLVNAYRRRILSGRNADGSPFTPVKESTKRIKKKQTGRDDLPPMHRTGELMRAFLYKVVKR